MKQVEISSMWRILSVQDDIALVLSVFMVQSVLLILDSHLHGIMQIDCIFCGALLNLVTVFKREITKLKD
jgi:hypothetical protein